MPPRTFDDFRTQVAAVVRQGHFFAPDREIWMARAPGRLDFMGGNVDYTGGMVLQLPIEEAIWVGVQHTGRPTIRVLNPDAEGFGWSDALELPASQIGSRAAIASYCDENENKRWGLYVFGCFHLLHQRYGAFLGSGADLFLVSDLPPNRGLASSAALEVAILKAASAAVGIPLQGVPLAEAAQWVENVVAGSACGIMDQAAIVLGRRGHLLPLLCQPCTPLSPIALPSSLRLWGIDSMAYRATNSAPYETARAAAFMAFAIICRWEGLEPFEEAGTTPTRWIDRRWAGYLSRIQPSEFRMRYEKRLPESIAGQDFLAACGHHLDSLTSVGPQVAYPVRAAARYAVEEMFRIETAKALLSSLDPANPEKTLRLIGELQYQSHFAYSECGLGSSPCDDLVSLARQHGLLGAKMTGGGGGGVVAVLGLPDQEESFRRLAKDYARAQGATPLIFEGSSDGTDLSGLQVLKAGTLSEYADKNRSAASGFEIHDASRGQQNLLSLVPVHR